MAIDTTSSRSRRALLAGVLGGLAAVATQAARPFTARAEGETIHVGDNIFTAESATWLKNTTTDSEVFRAQTAGSGAAIRGIGRVTGVRGESEQFAGVIGTGATGVRGSGRVQGVLGQSVRGIGVEGSSGGSHGVKGFSSDNESASVYGLKNPSFQGNAVLGEINNPDSPSSAVAGGTLGPGAGVRGRSAKGRGGLFEGPMAQVRLVPAAGASHPSSGQRGDLFVDASGRLWFCKGGTNWKQLA